MSPALPKSDSMLRCVTLMCIVPLCVCRQVGCAVQVENDSKKKDFVTCTDTAAERTVPESRGRETLLDSHRAYAALQSYVGTVTVESVADYGRGPFRETRALKVFFQRPAKIRLEGSVPNSGKFVILSDGRVTRVFGMGLDGTRKTVQDAMLEFVGVSLGASETLPSFLLDTKWNRDTFFLPRGSLLPAFATKASLSGEEKVGEHQCYRIVCSREIATWTFFVDKETFLIRRLDEDALDEQMRVQRDLGGGGVTGRIKSTHTSQAFVVEQINVKFDETIFARP